MGYHPQASVLDHIESALAIGLYVEKHKLERRRLSGLLREAEMNIRLRELEKSREEAGRHLQGNATVTDIPPPPTTPPVPATPVVAATKPKPGGKLQGLAAKVGKLLHDAEFEAEKLDPRVEAVAARLPGAFSGAHGVVDGLEKMVGDVEKLATGLEALGGNGGPALDPGSSS